MVVPPESTTCVQIFVGVNVTLLDVQEISVEDSAGELAGTALSRNQKRSAPIRTMFSSDVLMSLLAHGLQPDVKTIQYKSLRMFTSHFIRKEVSWNRWQYRPGRRSPTHILSTAHFWYLPFFARLTSSFRSSAGARSRFSCNSRMRKANFPLTVCTS